jgi:DNA repair protein RecO (recombination protein O)
MALEKAIVLHSIDYKDSAKLLYLYTEKGQKSCQVYGVKKMKSKYRYLAQNGTVVNVELTNAALPSLREAELISDYPIIKQDIIAYTYMNHIMELVRSVISDDLNHHKMMKFLEKIFSLMNEEKDPETLTFIFELKLLYFIGYGLNFKGCSICDLNEFLVFHPSNGGLICSSHLQYREEAFPKEIYLQLKNLYYIDLDKQEVPQINDLDKRMIRHILDLLFDEFVSFKTKSRGILKQLKKY